jgi:hypothetical protein
LAASAECPAPAFGDLRSKGPQRIPVGWDRVVVDLPSFEIRLEAGVSKDAILKAIPSRLHPTTKCRSLPVREGDQN